MNKTIDDCMYYFRLLHRETKNYLSIPRNVDMNMRMRRY